MSLRTHLPKQRIRILLSMITLGLAVSCGLSPIDDLPSADDGYVPDLDSSDGLAPGAGGSSAATGGAPPCLLPSCTTTVGGAGGAGGEEGDVGGAAGSASAAP